MIRHAGAKADYRRDDFFFARTQSRDMQSRQWEKRERRLRSRFSPSRVVDLVLNIRDLFPAERGRA